MRPKRVIIFSFAYAPLIGGAEVAVREITDRIDPKDIEFSMVTVRSDGTRREEKMGNVMVYRVGQLRSSETRLGRAADRFWKFMFPVVAARKALKLHREKPFDAAWSIMAAFAGFAALRFHRMTGVPYALTLQEGDPLAHIRKKVRFVRPLFKSIFKEASIIHAISNFLASFAKEEGAPRDPIVIGNGVDVGRFAASPDREARNALRKSWGADESDIILLTVSRLVKKNGVDVILKAMPELPERFRLVIAGSGPERPALQAMVHDYLADQRTVFAGSVPHRSLPAWFHAADMFVRPSRSEGFGNVFVEAMAAGLPVIATPVGGIPDIVEDGVTGLFSAVEDPISLARQAKRLVDDPDLRHRLVGAARERVFARYGWDAIAERVRKEILERLW